MKKFTLLLLILTFYGCSKIDDDTDDVCNSNCTTLQGRFVTLNDDGVKGVKVLLKIYFGVTALET